MAPKVATPKTATTKRELIAPNGNKRFIRRDEKGQITESDDVGKSLAADVRKPARKAVKSGEGDKGDQKRKLALCHAMQLTAFEVTEPPFMKAGGPEAVACERWALCIGGFWNAPVG